MQKQAGFVGSSRRPSRARCPPCGCWVLLDLLQLALLAAGGVDTHLANDGRTVVEIQPPAGHVFTFGEDLDMMLIVQNLDQRRAEGAIFAFQVIEEQTKARVGGFSGLLDGFQAGSDSFNVPMTMKFDSQLQPGSYGLKTQILVGAHEVASLPWHLFRIQRASEEEPYEHPFLELEIERIPPIFSPEDEAVTIIATVVGHKNGPLVAGQLVWARMHLNGMRVTTGEELQPLGMLHSNMESTLAFSLDICQLSNGTNVILVEVMTSTSPTAVPITANTISFDILSGDDEEVVDVSSDPFEDTPLMLSSLKDMREFKSGRACRESYKEYLRHRLWGVPTYMTQTELTMMRALSGGTIYEHMIDVALLALFPRDVPPPLGGSCAVVGSAGHLGESNLGAHIDAHDFVLRFNDAPDASYPGMEDAAAHVGHRTTHRLIHAASSVVEWLYDHASKGWVHNWDMREDLIIRGDWGADYSLFKELHSLGNITGGRRGDGEGGNEGGGRGGGRRLWMISMGFNLFVWRWVGARGVDKVPTSGMLGIMWALHSCTSVETYGFGPLPPCQPHAGLHLERQQV
jgi:hypothetical protein